MAKYADIDPVTAAGTDSLPPAGHERREVLKRRTSRLDVIAEELVNNTDVPVYAVDPAKLKEEPEILQHYDFASAVFAVSHPVAGKVYFWCRNERNAIAQKQTEARMWLGAGCKGWEIVGNCSCVGDKHDAGCPYPECPELKNPEGYRAIGDTILMRIDHDEYVKIHKRMTLVVRYRENNFSEKLSDFVQRHEGLVHVVSGQDDPRNLYAKQFGGAPLVHTSRAGTNEA